MASPTIILPKPIKATPYLLDYSQQQKPTLGGPVKAVGRIGTRFGVNFTDLGYLNADDARRVLGALIDAVTMNTTVKVRWPQTGLAGLNIGTPLVRGAGQTGANLVTDGWPASATIDLVGRFFSVASGSQDYLYGVRRTFTTDSGGIGTLPIGPLSRAIPGDNAPLDFDEPTIEGYVQGDVKSWSIELLRATGFVLGIEERA